MSDIWLYALGAPVGISAFYIGRRFNLFVGFLFWSVAVFSLAYIVELLK
jgi:hypothetical protein